MYSVDPSFSLPHVVYKQCYCVLFFNSHVDDTTNVMILNQSISVLSIFIFHPIQLVHKSNFLELTSYTVNLAE